MSSRQKLLSIAVLAGAIVIGLSSNSFAQRRGRVATRVIVAPAYVSPFWYYDPWYDPWFGGYDQWGPWGYPPYRGGYRVQPDGSLKLEVRPKQAEVYVDGYYAGVVDDFDGVFQRLRVQPGEHEIELYLDGYRAVHQRVYVQPDNTFKLKYDMERLGAGEQPEARPQPNAQAPGGQAGPPPQGPPQGPQGPPPGQAGRRRMPPLPAPRDPRDRDPRDARAPQGNGYGTLAIRVQPGDAEVLIDGQPWRAPQGQEQLVVEVAEGRHTIEIRKAGYRTYVTDVDVRRGDSTPVNVSLRSQEEQ